jgi:glycosyltransferase involved in cell wall biosynthesis
MMHKWIDYFLIKRSGLFDAHYYLHTYIDVRRADVNPLLHYVTFGWREGRNPSQFFDTNFYLTMNPDVINAGINPLVHYIRFGKKEGRLKKPPTLGLFGGQNLPENYSPKVTVIVPNYNHVAFLEDRLQTIYSQTYKNYEVILLDDCSNDRSQSILKKYAKKYPEITRCCFNETNSGSPFSQWKKGILLAEGDLIWIAESDDFCDQNFLAALVPYFYDESILLGYAHTIFVDRSGNLHPFTFESYVSTINNEKWNSSYIETANNEVNTALGILNTIPNVSSVIFRKIDNNFQLFKDPDWEKMKVCGDWIFYLNLICGGKIIYCQETNNYYRIHDASSSKKTHTQDIYYKEHEKVGLTIARLFNVSEDLLLRLHNRLKDFYFKNVRNGSLEKYLSYFDFNKVILCRKNRTPVILVVTYGFTFGGGEIFPIRLANALKENGVSVIFFNGGYEPTQPGVRKMLYPFIPVINNSPSLNTISMLREYGVEIIHTHHAWMENIFAEIRLACSTGTKHVATMHGMYEMMDNQFLSNTRSIIKSVDQWIYTAEKNLTPFKRNGFFNEKIFTKIENGMRIPVFKRIDLSSLGISSDSFTVCLASRALYEKGWLEAIGAIEIVRRRTNKDIHLILIGEGPVYDHLSAQTLPTFVHLLGYKADLDDYIASSQLGLLPSYFMGESFPLILIEFFMVGIPVVATRIGEIENMVTTDDQKIGGKLINLHRKKVIPDELADAIEQMVMDKDYYAECLETVKILKNRFDIDKTAKQYISVYQRLLG